MQYQITDKIHYWTLCLLGQVKHRKFLKMWRTNLHCRMLILSYFKMSIEKNKQIWTFSIFCLYILLPLLFFLLLFKPSCILFCFECLLFSSLIIYCLLRYVKKINFNYSDYFYFLQGFVNSGYAVNGIAHVRTFSCNLIHH